MPPCFSATLWGGYTLPTPLLLPSGHERRQTSGLAADQELKAQLTAKSLHSTHSPPAALSAQGREKRRVAGAVQALHCWLTTESSANGKEVAQCMNKSGKASPSKCQFLTHLLHAQTLPEKMSVNLFVYKQLLTSFHLPPVLSVLHRKMAFKCCPGLSTKQGMWSISGGGSMCKVCMQGYMRWQLQVTLGNRNWQWRIGFNSFERIYTPLAHFPVTFCWF